MVRFAGGRRTLSRMVPGLVFLAVLGVAELIARPILGQTDKHTMIGMVDGTASDLRASMAFLVLLGGAVLGGSRRSSHRTVPAKR